jgi:hypothetical protein
MKLGSHQLLGLLLVVAIMTATLITLWLFG